MVIADILSRRSDFKLYNIKDKIRTTSFNRAITAYTKDSNLLENPLIVSELKKFENKLLLRTI